jgi:hypothetical protein
MVAPRCASIGALELERWKPSLTLHLFPPAVKGRLRPTVGAGSSGDGTDAALRRGSSSFAFGVEDDGEAWDRSETRTGGRPLRRITKVARLYGVSPVAYPA